MNRSPNRHSTSSFLSHSSEKIAPIAHLPLLHGGIYNTERSGWYVIIGDFYFSGSFSTMTGF
ncbi:hypothetical protein [Phormidesmis priestleyi]